MKRWRRRLLKRAFRKHNKKRKASSIEKLVATWLLEDGAQFKKEKAIGQCHVDFYIHPLKVIETNGCYWHGHSCIKKLSPKQRLRRIKDGRRYQFFREKGYEVLVLWECFLEGNPDEAKKQLFDFIYNEEPTV